MKKNLLLLLCPVAAGALLFVLPGCSREAKTGPKDLPVAPAKDRGEAEADPPQVTFTNVTKQAGIDFRHVNGAFGKKLLPETLGSGVVVFDYDRDGKPDLFFVNSDFWPGHRPKDRAAPTMALYRNLGKGTFENVSEQVGLKVSFYGMGAVAGDVDNDGWIDLFVTGVGGNRLYRNEGGKKFVDVTSQAGDLRDAESWPGDLAAEDWLKVEQPISFPSSATFLDYDKDGKLDLFVCNYVSWSPKIDLDQGFTLSGHGRAYGPPKYFQGTDSVLYRGNGDGTFTNVTAKAGIQVRDERGRPAGKSLGVIACDVDDDGWVDIVVANDTVRNFFFHNKGDGTFVEKGQETGIAYAEGTARGAMGIDWGEYRPGQVAIVIGNFANEPNTLLRLDPSGRLLFADVALIEGIYGPSRIVLKFGLFFFDFDLDGRLDLLTCNGHLEPLISKVQAGQSYEQPVQLYWNTGGKRSFEPVTAKQCGQNLFEPIVGRSCAYLDMDDDGDLDVVLTENAGPARVFRNDNALGHKWVRLHLTGDGTTVNRDALGARVTLTAGGKTYRRDVLAARGYLSQSEHALTFGLGNADKIDRVEVRWPTRKGEVQVLTDLEPNRTYRIEQGKK